MVFDVERTICVTQSSKLLRKCFPELVAKIQAIKQGASMSDLEQQSSGQVKDTAAGQKSEGNDLDDNLRVRLLIQL